MTQQPYPPSVLAIWHDACPPVSGEMPTSNWSTTTAHGELGEVQCWTPLLERQPWKPTTWYYQEPSDWIFDTAFRILGSEYA
eukprot:2102601-Amphidinium_carterae.1